MRGGSEMAAREQTVRVSGLPTDFTEDRLTDKLLIHFLRQRHGGGEIKSISVVKETLVSALITFEDRGVAQRVIQHGHHILEVDEEQYELTLTEHPESLEPDKVVLSMSVDINYDQLPMGRTTVKTLHNSFPDIKISFNNMEKLCILVGPYSRIQAALAQLLGLPRSPKSAENKNTVNSAAPGCRDTNPVQRARTPELEGQLRKPHDQSEYTDQIPIARPAGDHYLTPNRDFASVGRHRDDRSQTEAVAMAVQLPGGPAMVEEDFSLIVDTNMFQYLQKHFRGEYQQILSHHGVDVIDATSKGVTTLFLQCGTAVGRDDQQLDKVKRLSSARSKISQLYQENERKICQEQLLKTDLCPQGSLRSAMENLRIKLPKLLLNEDDQNVVIIGTISDISEAKRFLLDSREPGSMPDSVASLLRSPSFELNSQKPLERLTPARSSIPGSLSATAGTSSEPKYKLAAKFKNLGGLGTRPGDFTTPRGSTYITPTGRGPILGHDIISDAAGPSLQDTTEDTSFAGGDRTQDKPLRRSTSATSKEKYTAALLRTAQDSPSGGGTQRVTGTGVKRAQSFSGMTRREAQAVRQREGQEDTEKAKYTDLRRSGSFSSQTRTDRREPSVGEMTVPHAIWSYIKEVFGPRLEDLTTGIEMTESNAESHRHLTIVLTAADSLRVSACQQGLQELVAMVTADFSAQKLSLLELGVTDPADETLRACCADVRSRLKKIVIHILKEWVLILGPRHLCHHVSSALREVFSGGPALTPGQEHRSRTSSAALNEVIPTQVNTDPYLSLYNVITTQLKPGRRCDSGADRSQDSNSVQREKSPEVINASVGQPSHEGDPVVEKIKHGDAVRLEGERADSSASQSSGGNYTGLKPLNGVGPKEINTSEDRVTPQRQSNTHAELSQKNSRQHGGPAGQGASEGVCICRGKGASVRCRACPQAERAIVHGNMSFREFPFDRLGNSEDSLGVVKITYCIPDGVQGVGHPSPGRPFKGGVFNGFFPLCERTKKLLPRLEKAFKRGLTFTVNGKVEEEARVTWHRIPHKSGNEYPDNGYLTCLSKILTSHGI